MLLHRYWGNDMIGPVLMKQSNLINSVPNISVKQSNFIDTGQSYDCPNISERTLHIMAKHIRWIYLEQL